MTKNKLESVITYLQMMGPPTAPPPPAPLGHIALLHCEKPTVSFYRYLYDTVGAPWLWYERRVMDDDALSEIINDDKVEIFVLYVHGNPAGYFELDLRQMPDMELAYFGLMPEFIGQGLGLFLLRQAIDSAWLHKPKRLWLHTCNQDHPGALPFYQRAGFDVYEQETIVIDDPRTKYADLEWPEA
ncbi:MAG: GNAT family N-acetyltransferase [Rhodospirillaceae bacterium]|nr:GNAT family N-acetyltransferase [Rhodospirillaceae bacterium]